MYHSWNFEQAKFDQLRAALDVIDWSAVLNSHDVDTAVATWSNLVLDFFQAVYFFLLPIHRAL